MVDEQDVIVVLSVLKYFTRKSLLKITYNNVIGNNKSNENASNNDVETKLTMTMIKINDKIFHIKMTCNRHTVR